MKQILRFLLFVCTSTAYTQNSVALNELFNEIEEYEHSMNPFHELSQGALPEEMLSMQWSDYLDKKDKLESFLMVLDLFDRDKLNRQEQISQSTMRLKLQSEIAAIAFKRVLIPFNAEGGFFNQIFFSINNIELNSDEDCERYFNWLASYSKYLDANISLMKDGIDENVVAPKVIVNNMVSALEFLANQPFDVHGLMTPVRKYLSTLDVAERNELKGKARNVHENVVRKGYRKLHAFVTDTYIPASREEVGICNVTNGKKLYEERVDYYTTLNIAPDSVFNLGLSEVSRIKKQMQAIIKELEFKGNYADFLKFLRTDPQFYPKTGQELLNYGAWLSKKAEGQLPKYFKNLYSLPFTVESVPDAIAATYTAGRYVGGNAEQSKPGIYWVNTHKLNSRTLYTFPALTLHEAVPGHHLQAMRAAEQKDIPEFRKSFYISAYGEGWALYGEYLGEEMNMYENPYDLFGRYTYEMWRACRLVVDVGLHYKNWSRQEAIDYMTENTALSNHEIGTEIDRYIGWPAQALSYKIGELTIKRLREKAEAHFGLNFDIKEFHEVILRNGSIPLTELIEEVNLWLEME